MSHTMKLWGRVVEARLRKEVVIGDQQFGFMPQRSTTDAIFGLRMLIEKWRERQKELHRVFKDLEKAYDRVPRDELGECMLQAGVSENYSEICLIRTFTSSNNFLVSLEILLTNLYKETSIIRTSVIRTFPISTNKVLAVVT